MARRKRFAQWGVRAILCVALILVALMAGCGGGGGGTSTPGTTTVLGKVVDTNGDPVSGAVVIVGTASWTGTTGPDGTYAIPNVPVGDHPVRVFAAGCGLNDNTVAVSGTSTDIGQITLPPAPANSPTVTTPVLSPSTGPSGTSVTVRVDVTNVTSGGTVRLASPELEQTWVMALESGNTYKATVTVSARTGVLKYRFFAAAYEGTKAGVSNASEFTLTGGATNANVTGVWKFFVTQQTPSTYTFSSLVWIHQADNVLTLPDRDVTNSGSINGSNVTFSWTRPGGYTTACTGTVTGRQMAGTYTDTDGSSGDFLATLALDESAVPSVTGSGPVTLTNGRYFDLSSGTSSAISTGADFQVALGPTLGTITSMVSQGLGGNEWRNLDGFRMEIALQRTPNDFNDFWEDSSTFYGINEEFAKQTMVVRSAEGKLGMIWVESASSTGMTFRYLYPYNDARTTDNTAPSVPTGLTATAVSTSQINLSWTANPEGDIVAYKLFRNGSFIDSIDRGTTTYLDRSLASGTTYTYELRAVDSTGNYSSLCTGVQATTLSSGTTFSNASLSGDWRGVDLWAGLASGTAFNGVQSGTTTFDGAGALSYSGQKAESGQTPGQPGSFSSTYSVASNGTTVSYAPPGEQGNMEGKIASTGDLLIYASVTDNSEVVLGASVKPAMSGMSVASLSGKYWGVKFSYHDSPSSRASGFGSVTFNGAGTYNLDGLYSDNVDGGAQTDVFGSSYTLTGSGALTMSAGTYPLSGGVSSGGTMLAVARVTDPSNRNFMFGIKAGTSGYTNASLSGTYTFVDLGQGNSWGPDAVLGTLTFNGSGGVTMAGRRASVYPTPVADQSVPDTAGTYSVSSDGQFTLTLMESTFVGGISADGTKIVLAQVASDTKQIVMIGTK